MDELLKALGPAFATGFAVQRLLEIADPALTAKFLKDNKKIILGLFSLVIGFVFSFAIGLHVLQPLGVSDPGWWDNIVTALIISAGTEGFNSIMKFLGYSKEDKKATAAESSKNADSASIEKLTKAV